MRLIVIAAILLVICMVSACTKGGKGKSNATGSGSTSTQVLGNTITSPDGWPAIVKLPANCQPCRTKAIDENPLRRSDNTATLGPVDGFGFILIGFEYPDGYEKLKSHFDSILLSSGYVVRSKEDGESIVYELEQSKNHHLVRIGKDRGSKNYFTIGCVFAE